MGCPEDPRKVAEWQLPKAAHQTLNKLKIKKGGQTPSYRFYHTWINTFGISCAQTSPIVPLPSFGTLKCYWCNFNKTLYYWICWLSNGFNSDWHPVYSAKHKVMLREVKCLIIKWSHQMQVLTNVSTQNQTHDSLEVMLMWPWTSRRGSIWRATWEKKLVFHIGMKSAVTLNSS